MDESGKSWKRNLLPPPAIYEEFKKYFKKYADYYNNSKNDIDALNTISNISNGLEKRVFQVEKDLQKSIAGFKGFINEHYEDVQYYDENSMGAFDHEIKSIEEYENIRDELFCFLETVFSNTKEAKNMEPEYRKIRSYIKNMYESISLLAPYNDQGLEFIFNAFCDLYKLQEIQAHKRAIQEINYKVIDDGYPESISREGWIHVKEPEAKKNELSKSEKMRRFSENFIKKLLNGKYKTDQDVIEALKEIEGRFNPVGKKELELLKANGKPYENRICINLSTIYEIKEGESIDWTWIRDTYKRLDLSISDA